MLEYTVGRSKGGRARHEFRRDGRVVLLAYGADVENLLRSALEAVKARKGTEQQPTAAAAGAVDLEALAKAVAELLGARRPRGVAK